LFFFVAAAPPQPLGAANLKLSWKHLSNQAFTGEFLVFERNQFLEWMEYNRPLPVKPPKIEF